MGSDSGKDSSSKAKKADSGPSLFGNMAEDLGNIFSGNVTSPHSAYDVRNAKAMAAAAKDGRTAKDFLRGGKYGPGGGSYSSSALHKAGIEFATARTGTLGQSGFERNNSVPTQSAQRLAAKAQVDQHNQGLRLLSTKAPAPATGVGLSDDEPSVTRATTAQARPTQTALRTAAPAAQTLSAFAQPSQKATAATPVASSKLPNKLAGTPPGMTGSATPAQQVKNVRAYQAHQAKLADQQAKAAAKAQAKAQKAAENKFTQNVSFSFAAKPQVQAMTAPKTRTYTQAQLNGQAQANRTNATGRNRVNDYLAEMNKPQYQPANRPPGMTAADARKAAWETVEVFARYRKNLGPREGGYADRPAQADPGGVTQKGMSQKELTRLRKRDEWKHLPQRSKDLTDAQINDIYHKEYFDRAQVGELARVPGLEKAAPQVAEQTFDSGVLHGIDDSGRWLQKSLDEALGTDLRTLDEDGNQVYDGIIGSKTRNVVERAILENKIKAVNNSVVDKRIEYMRSRPNFKSNSGWISRAESFRML